MPSKDSPIRQFLYSTTHEEKIRYLSLIQILKLQKSVIFEILPIPKVIVDNLSSGLDANNNVILAEDSTNDQIKEFQIMLTVFLNNHPSNNPNRVERIKNILFSNNSYAQNLNNNPSSFTHLFDLHRKTIQRKNIYEKLISYDRDQIEENLKAGSGNEIIDNMNLFLKRKLVFPRDVKNLNISDNFIKYKDFPLTISFKNYDYNSVEDCFLPNILNFYVNENMTSSLDMSYFSDIDDNSLNNVSVSSILSNTVPNIDIISFSQSLHFILRVNTSDNINSLNLLGNGNKVYITDFEGYKCLTNKSLNLINNPSAQNNYSILNDELIYREILNNGQGLFTIAKNSNIEKLDTVIIRTRISFKKKTGLFSNIEKIESVFTKKIPKVNLSNESIKINNINTIISEVVSY